MFNPDQVMTELAMQRPLFHSEADFQHALAWYVHEKNPDARIRLEGRPLPAENLYLDLWIETEHGITAIELKYATRGHEASQGNESFTLKNHGAQDVRRYDFIKDICRLERIANNRLEVAGVAIFLSNDPSYWKAPVREGQYDSAFRIHQGRDLVGSCTWDVRAGAGNIKGRELSLALSGRYDLDWRPYSKVGIGAGSEFRYLVVNVGASEYTESIGPT